jgi:hypothetical protein
MGATAVAGALDPYRGGDRLVQSGPLGKTDQRQQRGIGDQVWLIEGGADRGDGSRSVDLEP